MNGEKTDRKDARILLVDVSKIVHFLGASRNEIYCIIN